MEKDTLEVNAPAKTIRIVLVDDHEVMRAGLKLLVDSPPHKVVVGEASCMDEAVAVTEAEQPDVILLDLQLGSDNSLSRIKELITLSPESAVIILTGSSDTQMHRQAISNGAMGVVRKEQATSVLLKAIECVSIGEVWIERSMMAEVLFDSRKPTPSNPESNKIATLTVREQEIISLIGEGMKNKAIGEQLFISEITVRNHLASIFRKLDLNDRLALAIYAYRHKLVRPPD